MGTFGEKVFMGALSSSQVDRPIPHHRLRGILLLFVFLQFSFVWQTSRLFFNEKRGERRETIYLKVETYSTDLLNTRENRRKQKTNDSAHVTSELDRVPDDDVAVTAPTHRSPDDDVRAAMKCRHPEARMTMENREGGEGGREGNATRT